MSMMIEDLTKEQKIGMFIRAYEDFQAAYAAWQDLHQQKLLALAAAGYPDGMIQTPTDYPAFHRLSQQLDVELGTYPAMLEKSKAQLFLLFSTHDLAADMGKPYGKPWEERTFADEQPLLALAEQFYQQLTEE